MGSGQEALQGREDPRRSRALTALRELALARNDEIVEALGRPMGLNTLVDGELYRRRLMGDRSDAATLAKLFRLTEKVSLTDAKRALEPLEPADLADLGLASIDDDTVTSRVRVAAYEGLVLVSDRLDPSARSFVAGASTARGIRRRRVLPRLERD